MESKLHKLYRAERKLGFSAADAMRNAKIRTNWNAICPEYVQLAIVPDCDIDLSYLDQEDCFSTSAKQETIDRCNRDGAWGIVGQYRLTDESEWITVDSCWGFVGDDWENSGYDIDIMQATLDALRDAIAFRDQAQLAQSVIA